MSDSINNQIPFVPENTIDPAAGLNEAINVIDALLQLQVLSIGDNAPPGSPTEGDRYIVGDTPTGDWSGHADELALWLDSAWVFFPAPKYALNADDSRLWINDPDSSGVWKTLFGPVDSGWTAGTGTPNKGAFNAGTATASDCAQRILALEQAMLAFGVISA